LAISLLIVDLFSFRKDNAIHEFWGIFLSLYQPHLSADPFSVSTLWHSLAEMKKATNKIRGFFRI